MASRRWPVKFEVLKKASVGRKVNAKTGKLALHYQCAKCTKAFIGLDVQVDHIIPVVGKEGFVSWDEYVERMFCEADNFQILCKPCHKLKTDTEKLRRKKNG
jgi:5-methylcytosine-specific restriction endonuclease McrA